MDRLFDTPTDCFSKAILMSSTITSEEHQMMLNMGKELLCHMQIAKVQISMHIHAVWSGPSLSIYRISQNIPTKALIRLCICDPPFGFLLFAYAPRTPFHIAQYILS